MAVSRRVDEKTVRVTLRAGPGERCFNDSCEGKAVPTRTVHRYRPRARPDMCRGHVAQTLAGDARGVLAPTSGVRERRGSLLPAADMRHEAYPA